MHGMAPRVIASGVTEAEFSWVLESNSFPTALKKGGARSRKPIGSMTWTSRWRKGKDRVKVTRLMNRMTASADHSSSSALPFIPSASSPRGPRPARSRPVHQDAVADLRRGPALGAAAADRGQGVSQPPQASVLPARRRDAVPRAPGREAVGRILVSDDPRFNDQQKSNAGASECSSASTTRRGPRPVGRRGRLAPRPRPRPASSARSTTRSTIPPACWSKVSTRRRGS